MFRRSTLTGLIASVLVALTGVAPAHGSEVQRGALRAAFESASAAGVLAYMRVETAAPLRGLRGHVLPYRPFSPATGEPWRFCEGDPVGIFYRAIHDYANAGVSRSQGVAFLEALEDAAVLDVHSDGVDPIPLALQRTAIKGANHHPVLGRTVFFSVGIPVMPDSLLPPGEHTLRWTSTGPELEDQVWTTRIFILPAEIC